MTQTPSAPPSPGLRLQPGAAGKIGYARLQRAHRTLAGEVELRPLLRQLLCTARDLLDVDVVVLAVLRPEGDPELVHNGALTELPIGFMDHVRADVGSHDAPCPDSLLQVEISGAGGAFGTLYLWRADGPPFVEADTSLLTGLAATASIAVASAQRLECAAKQQASIEGSTALTQMLMARGEDDPLRLMAEVVARLVGADLTTVVLRTSDPESLVIGAAYGESASEVIATVIPVEGSLCGRVMTTGRVELLVAGVRQTPLRRAGDVAADVRAVLALPLTGRAGIRGVITASRPSGRPSFDAAEVQLVTEFAGRAAVSLEVSDANSAQQRLLLLEDRDRIARDLHDHVIQRLFGTGLQLEILAKLTECSEIAERLAHQTEILDKIIRQIRTTIFELHGSHSPATVPLRRRILELAAELTLLLGFAPSISFDGPVDTVADAGLSDTLAAVAREGLSNVLRHAHAGSAELHLATANGQIALVISDDGVGPGDLHRRSGLNNLRDRATSLGGTFSVTERKPRGTQLHFSVPLP